MSKSGERNGGHLWVRAGQHRWSIADSLATDPAKRETFTRLADHLTRLADEVEAAMAGAASPLRK
jgi:hypothetical protein